MAEDGAHMDRERGEAGEKAVCAGRRGTQTRVSGREKPKQKVRRNRDPGDGGTRLRKGRRAVETEGGSYRKAEAAEQKGAGPSVPGAPTLPTAQRRQGQVRWSR